MASSRFSQAGRAPETRAVATRLPHRVWTYPRDFRERVDPRPSDREARS